MGQQIPKPLTLLKGLPFLTHVLNAIEFSGVCSNPIIVVGRDMDAIRTAIGAQRAYAVQIEDLGTAVSVMSAEALTGDASTVLVLYSDHPLITGETIKRLVGIHRAQDAAITFAVAVAPNFTEWRACFSSFGRVTRNGRGDILRIVEAKDATEVEREIKEVIPGYMCFNGRWLWKNLKEMVGTGKRKEYYLTDLVGMAFLNGDKTISVLIELVEAFGVNTQSDLLFLERLE